MAHYLTFGSNIICTVNGESVSSGYKLHDGDVIVASTKVLGMIFLVNDDGTYSERYYDGDTVNIYDNDVVVSVVNSGALD